MTGSVHPERFAGQVVIVTGAAQGIGRTVAERVGAEGGKVVLVGRSQNVEEVTAGLVDRGVEAITQRADLEDYDGAAAVADAALERFGRIDVLINNVGGTIWSRPFEFYEPEQVTAEIQRSLFPTLWMCRAVLPTMLEQGQGTIVNVSSVATRGRNRVPYSAAKGGVNALTASLAMEVAERGVRVVATSPGGTNAPPRKVKRGGEPTNPQEAEWAQQVVDQTVDSSLMSRYGELEEQTAPILFLASREASYVTGSVLPVAGGDQG